MSLGPGPTLTGSLVVGPNSSPSIAADANGDVTDPYCPGNGGGGGGGGDNGGGGGGNGGGPPPTCSGSGGGAGGGGFGAPTAGSASVGGGSGSGSAAAGSLSFDTASPDSSGFGAPSSGGDMSGLTLSGFGGGAPWGAPSGTGALSGGASGGGSGASLQDFVQWRLSKSHLVGGGGGGSGSGGAVGSALALIFQAGVDVPCWTSTGVQGGCVAPATRIALFPQGCKAAGEVEVGDLLLTRTAQGELVGERVKGIRRSVQPCVLIQTEDARTLHCSLSHEVMIWDAREECARRVRVSELTPSHRMILEDGSSVGIKALTPQPEGPVLLLSLCGPHHYYLSEGLWSHNAIKTYVWP